MNHQESIIGCLLGVMVGDAIGLPLENMSRNRIARLLGDSGLRHRFFLGKGMVSDDTEHSVLVGQSFLVSGGEPEAFGKDLAKRLRWWMAGLPAGTGRATAKACIRLWLGENYKTAGIFSAGNGPPMRAPIIGTTIRDPQLARTLTSVSSRITHSDSKADYGALAVASVAHGVTFGNADDALNPESVVAACRQWIGSDEYDALELMELIKAAANSAAKGESTRDFADSQSLSKGITGYTYHTVPAALHACMRYKDDFDAAIDELIRCGGDVDSTAAIAGGIIGAGYGESVIPENWLSGVMEWPRTKTWTRRLADQLAEFEPGKRVRPITINPILQFVRNLFFLFVVLVHALRRVVPF